MAKSKKKYQYTVGRRKEAVARVRLFKGKGETVVNGKPVSQYFAGQVSQAAYMRSFAVTGTVGKFYATVKVEGSGPKGQLDAVVLGLARGLDKENKALYHDSLKKANLLTRDPRIKERRKPGTGGKARRQKQSPKR